jgi:hypothetical protein
VCLLSLRWFVKPFRFTLIALIPITAPTAIIGSACTAVICRLSIPLSVSPALCSISLAFLWQRRSIVAFCCPPVISLVSIQAVTRRPGLGLCGLFLSIECVESSAGTFSSILTIIFAVGGGSVVSGVGISGWTFVLAEIAAHLPMESFSTFGAKTLTRLDHIPTITVLVTVTSSSQWVGAAIAEAVSFSIASVAKGYTSLGVDITCGLVQVYRFVPSSRGERHAGRAKDDVIWVYTGREPNSKQCDMKQILGREYELALLRGTWRSMAGRRVVWSSSDVSLVRGLSMLGFAFCL